MNTGAQILDRVPLVADHAVIAAAIALGVADDAASVVALRHDLDEWMARFGLAEPDGLAVESWYRAVIARG